MPHDPTPRAMAEGDEPTVRATRFWILEPERVYLWQDSAGVWHSRQVPARWGIYEQPQP